VRAGNLAVSSATAPFSTMCVHKIHTVAINAEGEFRWIVFPAECGEDSGLIEGARGAALLVRHSKYTLLPHDGRCAFSPPLICQTKNKGRTSYSPVRPQEKICFSSYRARFRPITKTPIRPEPSRIMVAGSGTAGLVVAEIDAEYDVEIARPAVISESRD